MEALNAILSRHSARRYAKKKVPLPLLKKIILAGMAAPSAGNEQPWHFIIMSDAKALSKMKEFNSYSKTGQEAPCGILICADLKLQNYSGLEGLWIEDCAAAAENMFIEATALGLGAAWTAVHPMKERVEGYRKLLHFPKNIVPIVFMPIGYMAEKPAKENRFKKERIHYGKW
jgi:nitroreductase